jgi:DNA (cytosine-5)-methyltransferase 1
LSKRKIKGPVVVDLFAGCGGLSLGLEQAGFTSIFVSELNQDALDSYLANRDHLDHGDLLRNEFSINDVKELVEDEGARVKEIKNELSSYGIGDIDLVVGGPPCQGFSGIGHRRSYSVEKTEMPSNHLFQDMADVVERIQPKMFMFENVRGLRTARWTKEGTKGEIWEEVRDAFRKIMNADGTAPGYYIEWAEVRARDYGVPQNRPRLLMVGIRKDIKDAIGWEPDVSEEAVAKGLLPTGKKGSAPHLKEVLGDLLDTDISHWKDTRITERYPSKAKGDVQRYYRELRDNPKRVSGVGTRVTEQEYSKHSPEIYKKFAAMAPGREIPAEFKTKKFAQRKLPKEWDEIGPTITATSLPDDYVHYEQPRTLTVREWARLQGFPDWYEFKGKRTTGGIRRAGNPRAGIHFRELPKYTQIGNAVPVKLAKAVGQHFIKILDR